MLLEQELLEPLPALLAFDPGGAFENGKDGFRRLAEQVELGAERRDGRIGDADAERRSRLFHPCQDLSPGQLEAAPVRKQDLGSAVESNFGTVRSLELTATAGRRAHPRPEGDLAAELERLPDGTVRRQNLASLARFRRQGEDDRFSFLERRPHGLAVLSAWLRPDQVGRLLPGPKNDKGEQKARCRGHDHQRPGEPAPDCPFTAAKLRNDPVGDRSRSLTARLKGQPQIGILQPVGGRRRPAGGTAAQVGVEARAVIG